MAPDIARQAISALHEGSVILDPMCGSGVVLREAVQQGHTAIGFDIDPLAVLMSKVWTQPIRESDLLEEGARIVNTADSLRHADICLPWIDEDEETRKYIDFWFDDSQKEQLRKLSSLITGKRSGVYRALQLALSRQIVTKKVGASLAWDVSHSRPHKVKRENDYDVIAGFSSAVANIAKETVSIPGDASSNVRSGDAKRLSHLPDQCADMVITSPPYFNAIDYLRGHRLALVWLGYSVSKIRQLRLKSVGKERKLSKRRFTNAGLDDVPLPTGLDDKTESHLRYYVYDMAKVMTEIIRVLKPSGRAVLVVASSNIRGITVDNPGIIRAIGQSIGMRQVDCRRRTIPDNRRYLPPPTATVQEALRKRMRTECVLTLAR